ncbi:unnamed protein product [Urochloa humidicola]
MARSIDSDYIDFSHMGGFNMGIDFDGFEENVMKFMELPVKYLDSAHDKAVEFIEDFQAMFFAPFTDDEVPNEEDQSSSNVITESLPTSVETELTEASTPAPLITMENSSTGCVDADTHRTESFSSKSTDLSSMNHVYPENTSFEDSSEEVILWNPEASAKPQLGHTAIPQDDHAPHALETDQVPERVGLHCSEHSDSSACSREIPLENCSANYEEELALDGANGANYDSANMTQDYVPHTLQTYQPPGLQCSVHSDILVDSATFFEALLVEDSTANSEEKMVSYNANIPAEATTDGTSILHESSSDVPSCTDDPNIPTDSMAKPFDIQDISDVQEHMENEKIVVSPVPQRNNATFQEMFVRNLSRKLRWSKKQVSKHTAMPVGSQDAENIGYKPVSSSDDLEHGWELL